MSETPCGNCGKNNISDAQFCGGCGHPLERSQSSDPLINQHLDGRFKVIKRLGEGGMGRVYLAEQTSMGRPVALKVLNPYYGGDERIKERFRNEAALASRLNHPNTVIIYDFGVTDGGLMFIAMELVSGHSLKELLDEEGRLTWSRSIHIINQVCGSLQDAHEHAIIHRDLKPENIMLSSRGTGDDVVKVLDFGVAKILADNSEWQAGQGITAPNEIFGTPEYMSPEQARGDEMKHTTDIYSLGIMMFRMLTGHLPFDGASPIAILAKHLADTAPSLLEFASTLEIPTSLCELVDECLLKPPQSRPRSMADISRRLEKALTHPEQRQPDHPAQTDGKANWEPSGAFQVDLENVAGDSTQSELESGMRATNFVSSPPSAESMQEDAADIDGAPDEDGRSAKQKTLDKLIRQIRSCRDFPAISQNISELNTKVGLETTSASQLSNVILKDTSLTTRLIKLANSPFYGNTRGRVTMVSRAVVLMGFDAVREAALGLILFDQLQSNDPGRAAELRDNAISSLMGAIIAKEQAKQIEGINKEEAFICAMFHHLGKHAVTFYLPDEMAKIKSLVKIGKDEERAARKVLSVSYDELGQELAKVWDFPETIRNTMRRLPVGQLSRPKGKVDKLHHIAGFAVELTKLSEISDPKQRKFAFMEISRRFGGSFKIDPEKLGDLVSASIDKLEEYSKSMNLRPSESAFLNRVMRGAGHAPSIQAEATPVETIRKTRSGKVIRDPNMTDDDYKAIIEQVAIEDIAHKEQTFEEGLAEVKASMKGRFDLNGVMLLVLETMYRGLGLTRVIFCLNDVRTKTLRGRFGFGEDVDNLIPDFHFPPIGRGDIFGNAMSTGDDSVIINEPDKPMALKIPVWYKNLIDAPRILLFPIRVKQFPAALFYGDMMDASIEIPGRLMVQMKALRDQAQKAMEAANSSRERRRRR